jgi:hypothetical protein
MTLRHMQDLFTTILRYGKNPILLLSDLALSRSIQIMEYLVYHTQSANDVFDFGEDKA